VSGGSPSLSVPPEPSGARKGKTPGARFIGLVGLAVVFGIAYLSARFSPDVSPEATMIGAVGFLLLAGILMADLVELLGLPHLTGYLAAGIIAGPHVVGLIDVTTIKRLSPINTLALALIALAGGAELRVEQVRRGLRSLFVATVVQSVAVGVLVAGAFILARPLVPFARELTTGGMVAVAILWGVIATSRSPSATLGILAQTRARGPLTSFALAFVMSSDVVVILLLASGMAISRPLLEPGTSLSMHEFGALGHEIVAGVAVGTTLGLLLILYLRLVGKQLLVVLVALGFVATEVLRYLNFDPLLTFVIAGFVVQNLSRQGQTLLHAIEGTGSVVYVLFFASAGADLDIPLVRNLWPLALLLAGVRAVTTFGAARASSMLARDEPVLKRWGWTALVAQAGLTQGLAGVIEREYPVFGSQFRALVIANVALNAIVGPILFKLALDRSGESKPPLPALGAVEEAQG
jgi:Kef-type K+ transport system membrane component KefB